MKNYFKNRVATYLQQAKQDPALRAQRIEGMRYTQGVSFFLFIAAGVLWLSFTILRSWQRKSYQMEWSMFSSFILMGWVQSNNSSMLAALESMDEQSRLNIESEAEIPVSQHTAATSQ